MRGANTHVAKWGDSLAVRIPKAIAEQWGVQEGTAVEIRAQQDRVVLRRKSFVLADLVAQITPENRHPEQDFGSAQGVEEW